MFQQTVYLVPKGYTCTPHEAEVKAVFADAILTPESRISLSSERFAAISFDGQETDDPPIFDGILHVTLVEVNIRDQGNVLGPWPSPFHYGQLYKLFGTQEIELLRFPA